MKVIGFNYKKVFIEKKKEIDTKFNINTNIQIKNISKTDIELFKGKDVLNFDFEFKIIYEPDFAELLFQGTTLVYFSDSKLAGNVLKSWKNNELHEDIKVQLMNIIFSKSNLKALQLEEDLNLPPHLPSPIINQEVDKNNKN
jgi:hypothetical protein